jgi:hypothetical protein
MGLEQAMAIADIGYGGPDDGGVMSQIIYGCAHSWQFG